MLDLYDLIRNIQKRPAMYLGRSTISNLRTFIAGYSFARRQMQIPQTTQEQEFSNFQTWIKQKYNVAYNQTWDQIILFFSKDENSAFEEFFNLFDEFINNDSLSQSQDSIKVSSRK
ncbi:MULTISPECIES: hypothetical protein [Sphaerospermopsis]|uniref:Uncharacterized protein n=1 Tax=Sphaerospermopsis reniformis TaxID=531300 RepID=A0A480A856_9CYAN|nr:MULTISPECIES: hypothetical protein [Sphaerospermopsis]MBD2132958.1 hypothetical protein [Sphaerospermopsis sp. FACHB-1094]MBD2147227.1 hypothetical protein [Sphaerospermopsis sp. FACHB-1194]GCL40096.1 hypothetical protein SR1949_52300 [Sphaerospermopsis reniformis]